MLRSTWLSAARLDYGVWGFAGEQGIDEGGVGNVASYEAVVGQVRDVGEVLDVAGVG